MRPCSTVYTLKSVSTDGAWVSSTSLTIESSPTPDVTISNQALISGILRTSYFLLFGGLVSECRAASTARNRTRKVLSTLSDIEETHDLATSGYLTAADATALVQQALQQIPSVRESIVSLKLGTEDVDRLDIVKTCLQNFRNGANPPQFSDMRPSDIGAYQKMFQVLATVSSSPGAAKELIDAILAQTSGIDNSVAGGP